VLGVTGAERENQKWVSEQLRLLPSLQRQRAKAGWNLVYKETYEAEPDSNYKVNRARRAANTRLRLYVKKLRGE
tara:strand:- start:297 stop:518 length:222 start_codon:yes stop_codon:yes gene_type:complete